MRAQGDEPTGSRRGWTDPTVEAPFLAVVGLLGAPASFAMVALGASGRERENRPGGEKTREEEGEERGGYAGCSDQTAPTRGGVRASLRWPAGAAGGRGRVRLRPNESVAKLESLERAEHAALAPAVVLKTGFYILVWYTFSTCLTL
ncbi:putative sugar phosphate/phosphate translocator [Hordeum vulgare]|nr:putative sugar phosphate/phosphate translocator [Hordeum vulgare]